MCPKVIVLNFCWLVQQWHREAVVLANFHLERSSIKVLPAFKQITPATPGVGIRSKVDVVAHFTNSQYVHHVKAHCTRPASAKDLMGFFGKEGR